VIRLAHRKARIPIALVVLCVTLTTGCGGAEDPPQPVAGQVLVNCKPAARATVTFHPLDDSRPAKVRPTAQVDEKGEFRLTTFKEGDGAPEGEYQVTVVWYLATRKNPADDPVPVNYLPPRYSRPETSQLRVRVNKGSNTLEPFRLAAR
jgi:hypothetical protein